MTCPRLPRSLAFLALLLLTMPAAVDAAVPSGPRLAFLSWQGQGPRFELKTASPSGSDASSIAGGAAAMIRPLPYPLNKPAWSPDGSRIVFTGVKGSIYASPLRTALFMVSAEGGKPEEIRGAAGGFYPVVSPDGQTIAFARGRLRRHENGRGERVIVYESISTWLVELASGDARQLTPWRNRLLQAPSSFAPDGATLAVSRYVGEKAPNVIGLGLDGSADRVLVRNATEAAYSPDGAYLAFGRGATKTIERGGETEDLHLTDLYLVRAGGGGLQRLTHTAHAIESAASWDPSSQRLAYTRIKPFGGLLAQLGFGDAIMQVNADGSCPKKVASRNGAVLYGASWQPGPGRDAGPIAC